MQRLGQHRATDRVDPHPIAVQRDLNAPFGSEFGVRTPADIRQQARRMTEPHLGRGFATE